MVKSFRFDINALRALAVISVVLFHFDVPYFQGGFIGVDIFFVISGFLMAGIVCGAVLSNNFSFFSFYLSRARRIWPALFLLSVVLLVFGWFALMTDDYKILGAHVRESIFFTSNIKYFSEAGYFDQVSNSKWLLHTWSLSVEWQFYILYPIVIYFFYKIFRSYQALFWLHVFIFLLSFLLSCFYAVQSPSKAFYFLESRAWEIILGGSLFFIKKKPTVQLSKVLSFLGFFLLLISFFIIDESTLWPSPYALLPTTGAFLVILANVNNGIIIKSKIIQWIGERSYSIYLWHWPLVVLMAYYGIANQYSSFFIAFSLLLGHISYHFVENPTRKLLTEYTDKKTFFILLLCLISIFLTAQYVRKTGLPDRLPEGVQQMEKMATDKNPRQNECLNSHASCIFGGPQVGVIVLGDSHADSIVTALEDALPSAQQGALMRAASGCLFVKGSKLIKDHSDSCEALVDNMSDELNRKYKNIPIVIANRLPFYLYGEHKRDNRKAANKTLISFPEVDAGASSLEEKFEAAYLDTVCELAISNPVFILRPVPEMPFNVPRVMAREYLRGNKLVGIGMPVSDYHQRNAFIDELLVKASAQCGAQILDPESFLCDTSLCYGSQEGQSLYVDDDHLSEYGNKRLVPLFKTIFADVHVGSID